jgi:hypothetical protein
MRRAPTPRDSADRDTSRPARRRAPGHHACERPARPASAPAMRCQAASDLRDCLPGLSIRRPMLLMHDPNHIGDRHRLCRSPHPFLSLNRMPIDRVVRRIVVNPGDEHAARIAARPAVAKPARCCRRLRSASSVHFTCTSSPASSMDAPEAKQTGGSVRCSCPMGSR